MEVSLKTLHELYPNRRDFIPSIWNWLRATHHVEVTSKNTYRLVMRKRVVTFILWLPFASVVAIVWRGLSVIPEIFQETLDVFKPLRSDSLSKEHYCKLTGEIISKE